MDQATSGTTMSGHSDEANVFRVQSDGLSGWVVYPVGHEKTNRFLSQDLAVKHAQRSAQESRPSVVVVIEADGTVVRGWEFPREVGAVA
jgi:hypothetical protein